MRRTVVRIILIVSLTLPPIPLSADETSTPPPEVEAIGSETKPEPENEDTEKKSEEEPEEKTGSGNTDTAAPTTKEPDTGAADTGTEVVGNDVAESSGEETAEQEIGTAETLPTATLPETGTGPSIPEDTAGTRTAPETDEPGPEDRETDEETDSVDKNTPIIISAVQIGGEVADDEFVRLENQSDEPVDLHGYRLTKIKRSGETCKESTLVSTEAFDGFIAGNTTFVIAHPKYREKYNADLTYSGSSYYLSDDTTVVLYDTDGEKISEYIVGDTCEEAADDEDSGSDTDTTPIDIIISEIRIEANSSKDDFVELYNAGEDSVNLSDLELIRKYVSTRVVNEKEERYGKEASITKSFPDIGLEPGSFFLWANKDGKYAEPFADTETGYSLTENNALALRKKDGMILDSVSWGSDSELTGFGTTYENLPNPGKKSLVQDPNARIWSVSKTPTPTNNQGVAMPDPEPPIVPPEGSIRINELFPNPETRGEPDEWIELYNTGDEPTSFLGWTLSNGAKVFIWTGTTDPNYATILAKEYLILPRSLTKLALRNSDGTISLVAHDGTVMDLLSYDRTVEGASYGYYEGDRYRFSEKVTPGQKNRFGKEPKIEDSDIPKKGYRDVPVAFSAEGNEDDMRYVWDFGDEHKSYKQETTHRYEKTGTYHGSLTVRGDIEEVVKTLKIRIGKYPKYDLRITALLPNPDGRDTDFEWIRIENREKKSVDLTGWIIASGTTEERLVNHKILTESLSIGAGASLMLTRADARLSLPNKHAVIELRRPDGSRADRITYDRPDGIDRFSFARFLALGTPFHLTLPDSAARVLGLSDTRFDANPDNAKQGFSFLDSLFQSLNIAVKSVLR